MAKKIIVNRKGFVDITRDDYENGADVSPVNSWDFDVRGQYDSLSDLVKALNKVLYFDLTEKDLYFLDGYIQGSAMVDENDYLADDNDIKLWQNGEIDLFIADILLPVYVGEIHTMTEDEAKSFGLALG